MNRAPQAFILDEEKPKPAHGATKTRARKPRAITDIEFAEDAIEDSALVAVPQTRTPPPQRRFRWGALLLSALASLVLLWAGLALTQMIEGFFARSAAMGWLTLGIAGLAALAAVAMILREAWGLYRLNRIETLQEKAARAINLDDSVMAKETITELKGIYAGRPDVAWSLKSFAAHAADIMDPSDRVRLAERLIVAPLDEEAHRIIARRARRVTLLTTVTPAAALDILFVAWQNLGLLRELASLYGGRPSTLSTLRLARLVMTHLAVTGGLALSDNLIQHVIGKGLLGRLSARFGEGAVNGILTARIGLAAMAVCRPIPSEAESRETLGNLLREVVTFGGKEKSDGSDRSGRSGQSQS